MALSQYGINEMIVPSDGWRYLQPFHGGTQRIPPQGHAEGAAELVEQVRAFRATNRMEIGDVEFDVSEFIKKASPQNNRFPKRSYRPDPKKFADGRGIFQRIRDWLADIRVMRPKLMSIDEADERAKVCLECPQNIRWRSKCPPCNDDIDTLAMHLRQRPSYDYDEKIKGKEEGAGLKACRLHNLHLGAAVFLDRESLPPAHQDAPAACWLRATT